MSFGHPLNPNFTVNSEFQLSLILLFLGRGREVWESTSSLCVAIHCFEKISCSQLTASSSYEQSVMTNNSSCTCRRCEVLDPIFHWQLFFMILHTWNSLNAINASDYMCSQVGKDGCKRGVCTLHVNSEDMTIEFQHLGIQCVRQGEFEGGRKQFLQ